MDPSQLAHDPNATPEALAELARDTDDPAILDAIAQHPHTLIKMRPFMSLADKDTKILLAIARNPHTSAQLLERLYDHPTAQAVRHDVEANQYDRFDYDPYQPDYSREEFIGSLHNALAHHANAPESLLAQLASDQVCALWVAENPNTSPELLLWMAKRYKGSVYQWGSYDVQNQVAKHPNTPTEALDRIVCLNSAALDDIDRHPNASPVTRATIAFMQRRAEGSDEVFDLLFTYGDLWTFEQIGPNPATPLPILRRLVEANYPTDRVLIAAAAHPNSSKPILLKISDLLVQRYEPMHAQATGHDGLERRFNGYRRLFAAIVGHPGCDAQVLASLDRLGPAVRLFQMSEPEKHKLARATTTPEDMLRLLAQDFDQNLLSYVASNPNTPLDVLEALLDRRSECLDDILAHSQRATPEMLRTIYKRLRPSRHNAYVWLAANPNTPRDILENLARSRSRDIQAALARNPQSGVRRQESEDQ